MQDRVQLKLFDRQIEFLQAALNTSVRDVLGIGAQQSGKTIAAGAALLQLVLQNPREEFAIGAPTSHKMWDGTLRKFLALSEKFPGIFANPPLNERKQEVRFANGSIIFYRSYDQGLQAWEAMTLKGMWADEAHQMPREIYLEIRNRLTVKQGKFLVTARVPDASSIRSHWIYQLWQDSQTDPRIKYVQFSAWDNPCYPQEEIERKRRTLPAALFAAWVEGKMEVCRDTSLFPYEQVRAAQERFKQEFALIPKALQEFVHQRGLSPGPDTPSGPEEIEDREVFIGLDVAGMGTNFNVVAYRWKTTVFAVENWGNMEAPELVQSVTDVDGRLKTSGFTPLWFIDAGGMGSAISPLLSGSQVMAIPVNYSDNANENERFGNLKAEAYFSLRTMLPKLALPPLEDITKQLERQRYKEHNDGRLLIIKQDPSPDHLDAIVLSCLSMQQELPIYVF